MTTDRSPRRARSAAGWALFSGMAYQVSQALVMVVLAAILGPERFGVVALATIYATFIDFIVKQGIIEALVQRKDLDEDHLHAAFWMSMGTAMVLACVTIALSGWWADINDAPKLQSLLLALSAMGLLQASWQVPKAVNQRDLDFKASDLPINLGAVAGAVTGIAAAFLGAGEWSIVVQWYTFGLIGNLLLYRTTDWRPQFRFSGRAARELLTVSSGAFLATIASFISGYSDALVLGLFFGPLALGLYRFGSRLVTLIVNATSLSLSRVMLAVLSRVQDDDERFGRTLQRQLGSLLLTVVPILGILFAVGRTAPLLLGEQWEPTGTALRILCIGAIARSMVMFVNTVLTARGRAHRAAATLWFSGSVNLAAVIVAALLLRDESVGTQIAGVATARLLCQVLVVQPVFMRMMSRYSGVPARRLYASMSPPLLGAAGAMAVGLVADEAVKRAGYGPWPSVIIVGSLASVAAGATLMAVSPAARDLARDISRRLRRRRPATTAVASK